MIKFQDFETLNEIGDAGAKPFPWEEVNSTRGREYVATSDNTKYKIDFINNNKHLMAKAERKYDKQGTVIKQLKKTNITSLTFETEAGFEMTNLQEIFPLMATIVEIIKVAVKDMNIDVIHFKGFKEDYEKNQGLSKRDRVYLAFVEKQLKNFNGASFQTIDNHTYIKFKNIDEDLLMTIHLLFVSRF